MSDILAKYRANYQVTSTVKAFKRLQELEWSSSDELQLELAVLDFIEQAGYAFLTSMGVESLEQQYLLGYMKRLWVLALKYDGTTYDLQKSLLTSEYIARGHTWLEPEANVEALDAIVQDAKTAKKAQLVIDFSVFVGLMT